MDITKQSPASIFDSFRYFYKRNGYHKTHCVTGTYINRHYNLETSIILIFWDSFSKLNLILPS